MKMQSARIGLVSSLLVLWVSTATAGYLQDWQFNDPADTELTDVANAVSGGVGWSDDINQSATTGDGVFRVRREVGQQGSSWANIPSITNGSFSLIVDIAGWNFASEGENEEFRLGFTNNEGVQLTAQVTLERTGVDEIELSGQAFLSGDGATPITSQTIAAFSDEQTDPVALRVDYDATANTYAIFYKVNGTSTDSNVSWTPLGAGNTSTVRDGNYIRMNFNNSFSTEGAHFDVSRIYLMSSESGGMEHIADLQAVDDELRFRFQGFPDRTFTVEATDDLVEPDWQPVGEYTIDQGGQGLFTNSLSLPVRFFRTSFE